MAQRLINSSPALAFGAFLGAALIHLLENLEVVNGAICTVAG